MRRMLAPAARTCEQGRRRLEAFMTATTTPSGSTETRTAFAVLLALSFCHLLNDTIQSLLPALYPVLQQNYALSFTQIGLLHFVFQVTASLLQPAVGLYTDRRPMFRLSTAGMGASLIGLVILAFAHHYWALLVAAMAVGLGSAIFHPDSSRVARTASGGHYGFAQSLFQVGGNTGTAIGPLLAAFVVLPLGQPSVAWFSILALVAMVLLWNVGTWARAHHLRTAGSRKAGAEPLPLPRNQVIGAIVVLGLLVFSKYVYVASLTSYYTFYLIETFGVSVRTSQLLLFVFLGAVAAGTFIGGPIGDRVGRKAVIWVSILGALPFTLALPHANLVWTVVLTAIIGVVIASAFSAILVYAQQLVPGRVGMISGLFFGFAFGVAGVGAALLGVVADWKGLTFVYQVCAFLPLIGLLTVLLPPESRLRRA
jgi:FSR family fosmidomycin resistance protein-like MFS transporter